MLVISRREGESVKIGDDIEVVLIKISSTQVRLGFRAPKEVRVLRSEVLGREVGDGSDSASTG